MAVILIIVINHLFLQEQLLFTTKSCRHIILVQTVGLPIVNDLSRTVDPILQSFHYNRNGFKKRHLQKPWVRKSQRINCNLHYNDVRVIFCFSQTFYHARHVHPWRHQKGATKFLGRKYRATNVSMSPPPQLMDSPLFNVYCGDASRSNGATTSMNNYHHNELGWQQANYQQPQNNEMMCNYSL